MNDSIPLPAIDYDQMCKPTVDAISLPPVLQENTQPLLTDVRPPDYYYGLQPVPVNQMDTTQINLPAAPETPATGPEGENVAAAPAYT